jgi:uncharacterized membrane protein YfcA
MGWADGAPALDYTVNNAVGYPMMTGPGPEPVNHILPAWDVISGAYAAFAMLATPLGIVLLMQTTPNVARVLIAVIAIAAFLLVLLPQRGALRPGPKETALTGIAAGILTGFAAMPGPPVVPFYLRQPIPPKEARASMMLVFFATAIAGTISAFVLGLANGRLMWLSLLLFPSVLLGNWLGAKSFCKVPPTVWRSCVAGILGLAGISAVVRLLT